MAYEYLRNCDPGSGCPDVLRTKTGVSNWAEKRQDLRIELPKLYLSQRPQGLSQFFYIFDRDLQSWIDNALVKLYGCASGSDRAYAELALRQGAHISPEEPRIYNAPEGGVILETRTERGILTLLIEGPVGLLSRSADNFQVTAHFCLSRYSINEMLVRYISELKFLHVAAES